MCYQDNTKLNKFSNVERQTPKDKSPIILC